MDKNEEKKPWDDSFSDDRDEKGNLSRIELRKQKGNFKLILAVLISIVALIAIFSLAFGMSKQSSVQQSQPSARKSNSVKKTVKTKKDKSKAVSENADTKSDVNNESNDSSSQENNNQTDNNGSENQPATSQTNAGSGSSAQTTTSNVSNNNSSAQYTTVKQNEGIYRVATNAGIKVEQLEALNGLSANSVITPGQTLRIK